MLASKILLRLFSILCFAMLSLFISCEDLDTISFDVSQPVVFSINETAVNSSGKDYEITASINISQNLDLIDYLDRLEEVDIKHIEYTISNATFQDISLNNASIETSSGLDIVAAKSIALSSGSSGELSLNPPGVNDLETRLQGSGSDQLRLFGDLTRTPLACTVTVTFHLTVKARAI
jgi:hypothetical protein